ncbi:MAG TPA: hypothetical protein PKM97_00760 [Bacteroidia bacterium]|nr:hypothetical protein [Bacteroidia bacterium]
MKRLEKTDKSLTSKKTPMLIISNFWTVSAILRPDLNEFEKSDILFLRSSKPVINTLCKGNKINDSK